MPARAAALVEPAGRRAANPDLPAGQPAASARRRSRSRRPCSCRAGRAALSRHASSTSISRTAPAPTISISSRGSISTRSARIPNGSTCSSSTSCSPGTPRAFLSSLRAGRPGERCTLDPEVVIRMLDLVSSRFENVVIDLPRVWEPWTDQVLLGSNRVYVVTDMTVPGLRLARRMACALSQRLPEVKPRVIVNRFEQQLFRHGAAPRRYRARARRLPRGPRRQQLQGGAGGDRPRPTLDQIKAGNALGRPEAHPPRPGRRQDARRLTP